MIKRIIFDVDNTLLDTYNDCISAYKLFVNKYRLAFSAEDLYNAFGEYEKTGNYEKQDVCLFISERLKVTFDTRYFDELMEVYSNSSTLLESDAFETLKYLSDKYELVIVSNWYRECHKNRLEKVGIAKYFSKFYGVEDGIKPSEELFKLVAEDYSTCAIVGDSITSDIEIPKKLGMKTVLYNREFKGSSLDEISSLKDLKNIF